MEMKELEKIVLKTQALQEIDKVMNKYEFMLSHCQVEYVEKLFALHMPDVRIELSFGKWIGAEGVHRCIVNLHSKMLLDENGLPQVGTYHNNTNTSPIIEVADDLKTAKGMWVCPGGSNFIDETRESGFGSGVGTCLRVCDFIYDESDGKWKMWHYVVTGLTSHDYYISPADSKENWQTYEEWEWIFNEDTKPDGRPDHFWMYSTTGRIEYGETYNRIPEPYRTWDETFSY